MSYGFAGALQGLGGAMMKLGEEKRQNAQRLLEMEKKAELAIEVNDAKEQNIRARPRRGGRGSGGSGYALNPRERDDLARAHKGMLGTGSYGTEAPTEAQLGNRVEQIRGENRYISLSAAIDQAASEWGSTEVETTETEERSYLNPRRYVQGPTYEETSTDLQYGFNSALGDTQAAAGPSQAPARRAPPPNGAIQALKANPKLRDAFDAKYGTGAAASILGTQ